MAALQVIMATCRATIRGVNGVTLGFPAGFLIAFWSKLKTSLFQKFFSFTFQRAKTEGFSVIFRAFFFETVFLLRLALRRAFAVPPLEVCASFFSLPSSFCFCIISDSMFPFILLLLLVSAFLLFGGLV